MQLETYVTNPYRLLRRSVPVIIRPVEDARFEDLSKALGVDIDFVDLIDADPAEIRERQKLFKWLLQSNALSDDFFTSNHSLEDGNQTLPEQPREFMKYQHLLGQKHTNFWRRVNAFQTMVNRSAYRLPERANSLSHELVREGQIQYEEEAQLVNDMLAELRRLATFAGTLEFKIETTGYSDPVKITLTGIFRERVPKWPGSWKIESHRVVDLGCYGLWTHHEAIDPHRLEVPPPLTAQLLRWMAPNKLAGLAAALEKIQQTRLMKPAQIRRTPPEIAQDVACYLNELFKESNGFNLRATFKLKVFYDFGPEGLSVNFLSWELVKSGQPTLSFSERELGPGHLRYLNRRFEKRRNELAKGYGTHRVYGDLNDWLLEYTKSHIIESPLTDARFCYQRFSSVYLKFKAEIEKVMFWQNQVTAALDDLVLWRNAAVAIDAADLPYFYPEIDTKTARLEAVNAYPIRVRRIEEKVLFPFSTISLNGQIVNLGGKNNSGKSTFELTGLDIHAMAQSGLPVFAKSGVVIYPRRFILLSFLDRSSDQSTYMAKLAKDHEVIKLINSIPLRERKSVLAIIDELGSGTDQDEVLDVVRPFLDWLCRQKVSVLTSTQIRAVSDYIASNCGGENLVISAGYEIEKGVGSPKPRELAESIGFFESMKVTPP